jgi:hypothetical protein
MIPDHGSGVSIGASKVTRVRVMAVNAIDKQASSHSKRPRAVDLAWALTIE